MRLGFLGTGIMGGHMARRLSAAGFDVCAWNRNADKVAALARHGVHARTSPGAALASADTVIVMLSDAPAIDAVLFDADAGGIIPVHALRPGATMIVMSSIPVETARAQAVRLAQRGIAYVDAPVSGGEVGASGGTLAILAGGDVAIIEAHARVFAALGRVTRIGPVGSGQLAKLANQIIVGATMVGVAEAMHLASRGGADPTALRQALLGGFGDSKVLAIHGARMAARDFVPGSPAEYELKDLRTALAFAQALGLDLTMLGTLTGVFSDMIDAFGPGIDVSGVLKEIERRSDAGASTQGGMRPCPAT